MSVPWSELFGGRRLVADERAGRRGQGSRAALDRGVCGTGQGDDSCGQHDPVNCYGAVFVIAEVFDEFDHGVVPPKDLCVFAPAPSVVGSFSQGTLFDVV